MYASTLLIKDRRNRSKITEAVAESLTGINNAMKSLFLVNRSCIHKEAMQWVLLYLSIGHDKCY
jgi:hypothetical protein